MMKSRNVLLTLLLSAILAAPASALAVDPPTGTTVDPSVTSPTTPDATDPAATDSAPLTLDPEQLEALNEAANGTTEEDKSVFEKASDFVTDNAPWFIIGIVVLAAIVAGIMIMRSRPRGKKAARASDTAVQAGDRSSRPPSASELRRRKRAAIQRSREEERMRRKAGIEGRKAGRRGAVPPPAAGPSAQPYPAGLDPVEAEKQGARDQQVAAGAMARFGTPPPAGMPGPEPMPPAPYQGQAVPAPVSPSQTAPAAGVVTPGSPYGAEPYTDAEPAGSGGPEPETVHQPEPPAGVPAPEADTGILYEPSIENPGADAAVGNAARDFLAGGAAGAAAGAVGGVAAARASQADRPREEPDDLDPVITPEPGMAAEHALSEPEPDPVPAEPQESAATIDDRLRAKVAEIKASQEPAVPEPAPESVPEPEVSPGLAAVERRLAENSEERDRVLREAEERLHRIEQRTEEAERRAAFAERLAQLKIEESEREKRLNEVVTGIDRAEERAREAEARAEAAERAASAALEQSDLRAPEPEPQAASAGDAEESQPAGGSGEPEPPDRKGLFGRSQRASAGTGSDLVNLNSATFEELREAGLSVTQATRILAYRERFGGYSAVEDLEKVPGFPADLIENLDGRFSV